MNKKTLLPAGLGLLLLMQTACTSTPAAEDDDAAVAGTTVVTITKPINRSFSNNIAFTGTTQYQQKAVIRAGIAGYVHHRGWKIGDRVKAGSVFCTISSKEQEALKGIDQNDVLAKFRNPIPVTSGTGGVLTAVNYQNGDFVSEGDVLATLTKESSLVLLVNIPVDYLNRIKVGTACTVLMPDGRKVTSRLQAGLPAADPTMQTQQFIVALPATSLPEGANLKVEVALSGPEDGLAVPVAAVQTDETQTVFWVLKMGKDKKAYRVPVQAGKIGPDSLQEIKANGLSTNDDIIVEGAYGLADSSNVKLKTDAKPTTDKD